MTCRCGHGRHRHQQTRNAVAKRRARGLRPTGRLACQAYLANVAPVAPGQPPRITGTRPLRKCPCRGYVAQVPA